MVDNNGIEIRTGQIVEITGAYFKSDNGLYFVACSPGDPSWSGSAYSLKKISRTGKISKARRSVCLWPIGVFINNFLKAYEVRRWNEEHARIKVTAIPNMEEVAAHFDELADNLTEYIRCIVYDFGEGTPEVQLNRKIQSHYRAVAASVRQKAGSAEAAE